ncbi:MAG: molybdopterin-guanine dinucleotide biosynthesis protein B [Pseudomonadota bacterium]
MKVWGVTGWKNSGKTGLVERLVATFTERGLTVSTLKHAHHEFDVDQPGRDSHRHREAGAREVLVASDARLALIRENRGEDPPSFEDLLGRLGPADLILFEGFKTAPHPKIECWRGNDFGPLRAGQDPTIKAVAADRALDAAVPVLPLSDTRTIAAFIAADLGL